MNSRHNDNGIEIIMNAEKVRCPKCKTVMGMTRGVKINCPTCGELLDFPEDLKKSTTVAVFTPLDGWEKNIPRLPSLPTFRGRKSQFLRDL